MRQTVASSRASSFNLNARASVTLTKDGQSTLLAYWRLVYPTSEDAAREAATTCTPGWDEGRPISFPLWKLMYIFGPSLYNGAEKLPFKGNRVEIESNNGEGTKR